MKISKSRMCYHGCTFQDLQINDLDTYTVYATILQPCVCAIIQIVQAFLRESKNYITIFGMYVMMTLLSYATWVVSAHVRAKEELVAHILRDHAKP
jgi:hypothetical protein